MSYIVTRLNQLLNNYHQLPESVQADSLAMVSALKSKGEPINLIAYNSAKLQMATVTVENLVSFTEKSANDTQLGAANQLAQFITSLVRLIDHFQAIYSETKAASDIVDALKQTNEDFIQIYEAPYSVTIEIRKVASFTEKNFSKNVDCKEKAASQLVSFLKQLAKMDTD